MLITYSLAREPQSTVSMYVFRCVNLCGCVCVCVCVEVWELGNYMAVHGHEESC